MSDKLFRRCPYCDFRVTQTMFENFAEVRVFRHLVKKHKEETLELVRKVLEKAVADEGRS